MKTDAVFVYYTYVSASIHASLLPFISDQELSKASNYKTAKQKQSYLVSRALMRLVLSRALGTAPKDLVFDLTEHKKPFLKNHPAFHFNLSHSKDIIVLAVSTIGPVGIDVESLERNVRLDALKSRIFNDAELLVFDGLPLEKKQEAFINAWTRKEAFLKALGVGLRESPKKIEITFEPKMEAKIISLPEGSQEASWSIKSLDFTGNYRGAVIVKGAAIQTSLVLVTEFEG